MEQNSNPLVHWLYRTISGRHIAVEKKPRRYLTAAGRHERLNINVLRKRRAKNKVARRQRRINRITSK